MQQPVPSHSFTTVSAGGLLAALKNRCSISLAFDPASGVPRPQPVEFDAIWDTGATNSVITQAVVDACGLAPIGMVECHGVTGSELAEIYLVDVYLPNLVMFASLKVTKAKQLLGADILVGMDLISQGDFAVTNFQGVTKFSFRVPSKRHIDFVQEQQQMQQQHSHGGRQKNRPKRPPKTFGKNKKKAG